MSEVASQIVSASEAAPAEAGAALETPQAPAEQQQGDFAAKFAALSKRERKIQEQLTALKTTRSELDRVNALKEKVKENPLTLLEEYGVTIEQLLTHSLGDDAPPLNETDKLDSLRREIESIKAEAAERTKAELSAKQAEDQAQIEEAILSHRFKIQDEVSKDSDKYELINLNGESGLDLVWEVTEQYFTQHGKVLTPSDAAEKVETYLENEARKLLGVKKLKPRESEQRVNELVELQLNPQQKQNFTLSQELHASPQARQYNPVDLEESKARAAAMLKWT